MEAMRVSGTKSIIDISQDNAISDQNSEIDFQSEAMMGRQMFRSHSLH